MILDLLSHWLGSAIFGFTLNEKRGLFIVGQSPWLHHLVLAEPGASHGSSFPLQIHAYNLETNTWEEITTKPHEKIGEFGVSQLSL